MLGSFSVSASVENAAEHIEHVATWVTFRDGSRAIVDFVLDDPEYIAEPLSDTRELIYSPEIPIYPFDCDTRSTSEFLPD